jgi:signal transduction histidine kinase
MSGIISLDFFAHIAHLAASACQAPCVVAAVDTSRGILVCTDELLPQQAAIAAFETKELVVAPDLPSNAKYNGNTLVVNAPNFVSFIGLPLTSKDGLHSGTLCIWHTKPLDVSEAVLKSLQSLAVLVSSHLNQVAANEELIKKIGKLHEQNESLSSFANIAAHDLRGPLNSMISLTHLLELNYGEMLDEEGNEYIRFLGTAAGHLSELVSGIHAYSKAVNISTEKSSFRFADIVEAVMAITVLPESVTINYSKDDKKLYSCHAALMQILLNLLDNAIACSDKSPIEISIGFEEEKEDYIVTVKDNGPGLPVAEKDSIFDLFKVLQKKIKGDETASTGLAIVKKLVDKMDGSVSVKTAPDQATEFIIRLPK